MPHVALMTIGLLRALTCSVWRDAESAFAFSYRGIHGAALRDHVSARVAADPAR